MGLMDKAKEVLGENKDKVEQGVDKAAETVNEKTGGKYADQVDTGREKAKEGLQDMGK